MTPARRLVLLVLLGAACGDKSSTAAPPAGQQVAYTPPAETDLAALPLPKKGPATVLLHSSDVDVEWVPPKPGPMTALSRCSRWVVGCASAGHALDDCARSVPACTTAEPWNEGTPCCPAACLQRYQKLRASGSDDIAAFDAAYFDRHDSCFPGLTSLIGG